MNLKISRELIKYFIPVFLSFLFITTSIIIDGIFVANRFGEAAIAAMSIVQPFYLVAFAFCFSLQIGGQTYVAMAIGEGDKDKANSIFTSLVLKSFITNLILVIVIYLVSIPILNNLVSSVGSEVIVYARTYLNFYLLSLPIFGPMLMMVGCLKLDESPRFMLIVSLIGTVVNIVFNFYLLFILQIGIAGSALATVISNLVQLLLLIYFYQYKSQKIKFKLGYWSKQLYIKTLVNGSSDGMLDIAAAIRTTISNGVLLVTIGTIGIAAAGYINYIYMLLLIPSYALADSVSPFISKAFGAKDLNLVNEYRVTGIKLALIIGALMTGIIILNLEQVFSIFNIQNHEVLTYILSVAPVYYMSLLFAGYNQNQVAYLTAIDHGKTSLMASVLRNLIFVISLMIILALLFGDRGMWSAAIISEMISAVVVHFIVRGINRQKNIVQ